MASQDIQLTAGTVVELVALASLGPNAKHTIQNHGPSAVHLVTPDAAFADPTTALTHTGIVLEAGQLGGLEVTPGGPIYAWSPEDGQLTIQT